MSNVWDLKIPPRVQFFLWLLTNNKHLTRDNLGKRKKLEDESSVFCNEKETNQHLFFDCVVAKRMWKEISAIIDKDIVSNFESIGIYWLSNKRFLVVNMLTAAAIWSVWKYRNDVCFRNLLWQSMGKLLMKIAMLAQNWIILCPADETRDGALSELSEGQCNKARDAGIASLMIKEAAFRGMITSWKLNKTPPRPDQWPVPEEHRKPKDCAGEMVMADNWVLPAVENL